MKGVKSLSVLSFFAMLSFGCAAHTSNIRSSFLQVHKTVDVSGCGISPDNPEEEKCAIFAQLSGVGSGAIVHNQRSIGGSMRTLVMTADHVCHERTQISESDIPSSVLQRFRGTNEILGHLTFRVTNTNITLKDSRGTIYQTASEPILRNPAADICILETSINQRALAVARSEPNYGDRIVNISAPYGLMYTSADGGAVYITDGRYAGNLMIQEGPRSMYIIWTAPGSSGSPILNSAGEIVGVVSAISTVTWPRMNTPLVGVVTSPSNITFGPTLDDVRMSVRESIAALKRGQPYIHNGDIDTTTSNQSEVSGDTNSGQYVHPYILTPTNGGEGGI